MKTLAYYKNRYKKAVKSKTREKIINGAMLNLNYKDQKKFIQFQTDLYMDDNRLLNIHFYKGRG